MDQDNLDKQMREEDAKAGTLRRKHLMPEDAEKMARKTKLTNDVRYVADSKLVLWHHWVPELLVKEFWKVPAAEMDEKFQIAAETFVHWPHHNIHPDKIKTKLAKVNLIFGHIDWIKATAKRMSGFIDNLGGFNDKAIHSLVS